jgi:hypothetical protein
LLISQMKGVAPRLARRTTTLVDRASLLNLMADASPVGRRYAMQHIRSCGSSMRQNTRRHFAMILIVIGLRDFTVSRSWALPP